MGGDSVDEGLVVRVMDIDKHPEWSYIGAVAIVRANFNTTVPTVEKVTEATVTWAGIPAPKKEERWGAADPRIAYRPDTKTYYLAFDNCTNMCGFRQTLLSTS